MKKNKPSSRKEISQCFIYLASQSERRKDLLKEMGIRFKQISSSYHEKPIKGLGPKQLVLEHAEGKARGASVKRGWILGADTVVYCRGRILGKPKHLEEALSMMKLLSGKTHEVYTGLALYDPASGQLHKASEKTKVTIKKMTAAEMHFYFSKVPPWDKAGAYAIQMPPKIVTKITGSYSNVVGLPKQLLRKMIRGAAQAAF